MILLGTEPDIPGLCAVHCLCIAVSRKVQVKDQMLGRQSKGHGTRKTEKDYMEEVSSEPIQIALAFYK